MPRRLAVSFALLAGGFLPACVGSGPGDPSTLLTNAAPVLRRTGQTIITGQVFAPQGVVANNGARIIGLNSSGIIGLNSSGIVGLNSSGLVGGTRFHLAAKSRGDRPLANTWVVLADPKGDPLPGTRAVRTDALGYYRMERLPAEYTYHVVALVTTSDGKDGLLSSLVHPGIDGGVADISAATTIVASSVTRGSSTGLGALDTTSFREAVGQVADRLTDDEAAKVADPATREAVTKILVQGSKAVAKVKARWAAEQDSTDQLKEAIKASEAGASPSPAVGEASSGAPMFELRTAVGLAGEPGNADGAANVARFDGPSSLIVEPSGGLLVADQFNDRLRRVDFEAARVDSFLGAAPPPQFGPFGPNAVSPFQRPRVVAMLGGNPFVFDAKGPHLLEASTGNELGLVQNVEQAAALAKRIAALDVVSAVGRDRKLYLFDRRTGDVRVYDLSTDRGSLARTVKFGAMREPGGLAVAADGSIWVADAGRNALLHADAAGTLAPAIGGGLGNRDGALADARFNQPTGLAWAPDGSLYVADTGNHCVRRVDLGSGKVTTALGLACVGTDAALATLQAPRALAFSASGTLYVADGDRVVSATAPVAAAVVGASPAAPASASPAPPASPGAPASASPAPPASPAAPASGSPAPPASPAAPASASPTPAAGASAKPG